MKHIKTLGLLALGALALAAFVGATSAAAATSFTASVTGRNLIETPLEKHVFTTTGVTTSCNSVTYTGKTEGTASGGLGFTHTTGRVSPTFTECTVFGFSALVTNNGCTLVLLAVGSAEISPSTCTLTILVENAFATCHVEITGGQTVGGLIYANKEGKHIDVTINSSGIKSHVTKSSGFCPLTVGTHKSTYQGKSTVGAEGAAIGVD
jgi:hypothetical protein